MATSAFKEPSGSRAERERDLFLRLLEIGRHEEVGPFLEEALALIVEISGAQCGYVELHPPAEVAGQEAWSIAYGLDQEEVAAVRERLSSTIIAEALASEAVVETPFALHDVRFHDRDSVRKHRIEAALCAPVGRNPAAGVLYLQGTRDGSPFDPDIKRYAELFAHHLAPAARRIVRCSVDPGPDPTLLWRERLRGADAIVGRSAALAKVLKSAALAAPLDIHLLITGPSGCGKTALAELIASNGPRAGKPFVAVNCAALPTTLIENELFGAVPGAHATATRKVIGKVAAAHGGTLFLDEVGELALEAQAKLLQLLQSGVYYALGSSRPERADLRVIAATNVDLEARIADGRFREDLFYRLRVLPIDIPGLDARRRDIAPLARAFCEAAYDKHGLPRIALSHHTLHALELASWPGHIRQLAHAVEAAVVRAFGDGASQVQPEHAFPDTAAPTSIYESVREHQRRLMLDALGAHQWNVSKASESLGMARSHAYSLMSALGIRRRDA